MHDAIAAEREGTPALAVMTTNFVSAAELMSRVLGVPDYEFGVIEHPVSSADDGGLQARAQATVDLIASMIAGASGTGAPA